MNTAPVFIVGASRSGTTMLRLLLNAHPHIAVPGEIEYFSALPDQQLENWRNPTVNPAEFRSFLSKFLDRHDFEHIDKDELQETILDSDSIDLRRPYELMLRAWANTENQVRWGEKTPANFFYVDIMHDMFPDAQFIHLVRDPRAVVHSMNRFVRMGSDTTINAHNWRQYMTKGYTLFQQVIPEDQRITIRYEDLTANPEETARSLCTFLNEPYDPEMLNFYESSPKYMPKSFTELGGSKTVTKPIQKRKKPKWKDGLSTDDVGIVEMICGRTMKQFGYKPTTESPGFRGYASYLLKSSYYHWKQWIHRNQRFHVIRYQPPAWLDLN